VTELDERPRDDDAGAIESSVQWTRTRWFALTSYPTNAATSTIFGSTTSSSSSGKLR
jgi:hypothetical protein